MRELLQRLWYLVRRRRFEADLAEELALHREMKARDLEAEGLAPSDAAAAARRTFGSVALAQDQARDVWMWAWLQDLALDLRFAIRLLRKDRRFTTAAIVALALAIAANTTIFTFINTTLFKDLPFDEPRQVVTLGTRDARGPMPDRPGPRRDGVSYLDFEDWQAAARSFSGMAAAAGMGSANLSGETQPPERLSGMYVSSNTFDVLRVRPVLGRGFLPDDERPGAPPVVVLSDTLWERRYQRDASVIGRTVRVNDIPAVIVGVMPPGFAYPLTTELWQPLALTPGLAAARRDARTLDVIARLAGATTSAQAESELTTIATRLAADYPETNRSILPTVAPPLQNVRRSAMPLLFTLMGAVAFVLLIACSNVATLLLARAAGRAREIAIRASLGATRRRIVRQLLIESLSLAAIAGPLGLVLSVYGVRYFGVAFDAREVAAPDRAATPYWVDLTMDWRVFSFVAALCLGSSILFGMAPALHLSKVNVNDTLKDTAPGTSGSIGVRRWTSLLLIGELALTVMLLSQAGLLARSFLTRYRTNLVIASEGLYSARLALPAQKYATLDLQRSFVDRLDRTLQADAGIDAAIASDPPFVSFGGVARQVEFDGRPAAADETAPRVSVVRVGPRYLETLGLRLLAGRDFGDVAAQSGNPPAIVDDRFAARFFAGDNPVGRRVRVTGAPGAPSPWLSIAGIVGALPQFTPAELAPEGMVYVPIAADEAPFRFISIVARGRSRSAATASRLREDVRAIDPDLPLFAVEPVDEALARTRFPLLLIGSLIGFLAASALVLASVGLFAITAHAVAARTHEIGIRMALGAQTRQVQWLFVRRTLVHLAFGLVLGAAGALATGRLLQSFLVRTNNRDPLTFGLVAVIVIAVSLTACFLPARRAALLDPLTALRHE